MHILAVSLADDSRRFIRGFPPKGARLLLNPDLEIAGLASVAHPDQIVYQDEKVEPLDLSVPFDWALLSTDFWQESRIREVALDLRGRGKPVVLFGPIATTRGAELSSVADAVVAGNILNVWGELRADAERGQLKRAYVASTRPAYAVPNYEQARKPVFEPSFQCLRAIVGCRCPELVRPYCRQYLYHRDELLKRNLEELAGEVLDLRGKHVYLLDEDIAEDREWYQEFFSRVWRFKREWTVLAGARLFSDPRYIHLLAKAGVRVVTLTEDWLNQGLLTRMMLNRGLVRQVRNQVRLLHRQRLLVGARVSLFLNPDQPFDYVSTYKVIETLSIDFLQVRTFGKIGTPPIFAAKTGGVPIFQPLFVSYQPGLAPDLPTWWKNQFYGLGSIIKRSMRRLVRVGFYSTFRYYYPRSLAFRQNFLEGIAYPP
jgi:hypothetical protein